VPGATVDVPEAEVPVVPVAEVDPVGFDPALLGTSVGLADDVEPEPDGANATVWDGHRLDGTCAHPRELGLIATKNGIWLEPMARTTANRRAG